MPADLTEPIFEAAAGLLRKELHGQRIRLVGVTASNFRDREQLELFAGADDPKRHQAAAAMDTIRRKYGERSVTRGRLVRAGVPTVFERDPNSAVEGRLGVPEEPTGTPPDANAAHPRSPTRASIRPPPTSPDRAVGA